MSKIWMVALSALVLSACSNQYARRSDAFERAGQEIGAAAASRTKAQGDVVGQAMVPPLQLDQPAPAKPEPRFNLAVNNAPVAQVLNALVSGTPYSMLFSPELSGTVSLNLKNTTVREALDTLRDVYGYDYRVQGNRITVQPNTVQTRLFKINYLANRRQGMSDIRVTGSSPTMSSAPSYSGAATGQQMPGTPAGTPGTTGQQRAIDSARVQTSSDYDFWTDLTTALKTIVGNVEGRNVIVNPASGVVLVKASPVELRAVDDYLKATQLIVERQVMLEAKIIEVSLNDSYQTGINWSKFGGLTNRFSLGIAAPNATLRGSGSISGSAGGVSGGTNVTSTPGSSLGTDSTGQGFFGLAFQSSNFAALLSFLEGQGDVQVLSSPRIATTNNQKAVLKVGTDDYFVTGVSTNTTTSAAGNVTTPNIMLQPFFSGIALDVMPQIDDDGNIILHVHPSVSVVEEKTKNVNLGDMGNFTLPLASSTINESDSIVRVQDGSIVAIGGLMSQEQNSSRNGLPGISGVQGIGALFGQKSVLNRKRELVILMRSTVIKGEESWRAAAGEAQERLQGLDPRQQRHIEWQ